MRRNSLGSFCWGGVSSSRGARSHPFPSLNGEGQLAGGEQGGGSHDRPRPLDFCGPHFPTLAGLGVLSLPIKGGKCARDGSRGRRRRWCGVDERRGRPRRWGQKAMASVVARENLELPYSRRWSPKPRGLRPGRRPFGDSPAATQKLGDRAVYALAGVANSGFRSTKPARTPSTRIQSGRRPTSVQ